MEIASLKAVIEDNKGQMPAKEVSFGEGTTQKKYAPEALKQRILRDIPEAFAYLTSVRKGRAGDTPVDIGLGEFIQERFGFAPTVVGETSNPDSFYQALGISGSDTIEKLAALGDIDPAFHWIIPEIFREAVRLGLRRNPAYTGLIRQEENVSQLNVNFPDIKLSAMDMAKVGEGESISMGSTTFGTKSVKLNKIGKGFNITDEAVRYTTLNLVSIAFQDAGVNLAAGLDTMLINTLINGDQAGGTDSCAVVGTVSGTSFTYYDILRAWVRMGRIGGLPTAMISNETPFLDIHQLPEFKGYDGVSTEQKLVVKTPIPAKSDVYVHGAMPSANYVMFVDKLNAAIKLNATALIVENDRDKGRQMETFYITTTTGFATLKRDARLILDKSQTFVAAPFPSYFDVASHENVIIS